MLSVFASSSYSSTASYALNAGSGTSLVTASTYPITSSWANNVITASYVSSSTYAPYIQSRQLNLVTNGSGLLNNNYNFSVTLDGLKNIREWLYKIEAQMRKENRKI